MLRNVSVRVASAVIALALACAAPAWASPAFVQTPSGGTACTSAATTAALTNPPVAGHVVAAMASRTAAVASVTLADSNSVNYPRNSSTGTGSAFMGDWDATVSGSPTATYTWSAAMSACMYEMSGVGPSTLHTFSSTASSGATVTETISSGVQAGDLLLCLLKDATNTPTLLVGVNGTITADAVTPQTYSGHMTATATATTSCTWTVTSGDNIAGAIYDYTTPAAFGTSITAPPWIGAFLPPPNWRLPG